MDQINDKAAHPILKWLRATPIVGAGGAIITANDPPWIVKQFGVSMAQYFWGGLIACLIAFLVLDDIYRSCFLAYERKKLATQEKDAAKLREELTAAKKKLSSLETRISFVPSKDTIVDSHSRPLRSSTDQVSLNFEKEK